MFDMFVGKTNCAGFLKEHTAHVAQVLLHYVL